MPFGARDIGPALEELRRKRDRNGWRLLLLGERRRRDAKLRGTLASEHRDGVLKLSTLHTQIGRLRPRGLKLGPGLLHIHARNHSLIVPIIGKLQRPFVSDYRGIQEPFLGVHATELKIVSR